jgi:hypothetical protein
VIGCEEPTNSERAQYHFLRSSLMEARDVPSFVTTIWFPEKAQRIEHHEGTHVLRDHGSQSDSILEKLNNSQKKIVDVMLSPIPQDSLVIAHGIVTAFFIVGPLVPMPTWLHRASWNRKNYHDCRSSSDMAITWTALLDNCPIKCRGEEHRGKFV